MEDLWDFHLHAKHGMEYLGGHLSDNTGYRRSGFLTEANRLAIGG